MTRTEATTAKLKLLQAIAEDSTLAPTDYRLAILLLTRHFNSEKGYAWPSRTRLAEEMDVALCTVTRSLKRLETRGHLTVRRDKGRSHTNRYYPAFVAVTPISEEKVASVLPINNDEDSEKVALTPIKGGVDAHKRVHGRHTTPFTTPIKNPVNGHASLASPPEGGSRTFTSKPPATLSITSLIDLTLSRSRSVVGFESSMTAAATRNTFFTASRCGAHA